MYVVNVLCSCFFSVYIVGGDERGTIYFFTLINTTHTHTHTHSVGAPWGGGKTILIKIYVPIIIEGATNISIDLQVVYIYIVYECVNLFVEGER